MAAHAITGLNQTLQTAKNTSSYLFRDLRAALQLSCWTEDLSLDGYSRLSDAVKAKDFDAVEKVAQELLVEMSAEWADLGLPTTREDWLRVKYGLAT